MHRMLYRMVHRMMRVCAGLAVFAAAPLLAQSRPVVLITGSTDGLGRELAYRMAATGAHVIVHGRNKERGNAVVDSIRKTGKGSAAFFSADFSSLAQVRAFADTILKRYPRLDILVNNAGIWTPEGPRQVSADGYEMTFAVNYLAGYLLTKLLEPRLIASAPSRIVNVASISQSPIDFTDVNQERGYNGGRAYGMSKLAQVMFTIDLAKELEGKRVTVVAVHPASQMDTHLVRATGRMPRSTVDEGADAVMNVITGKNITNGGFYAGLTPGRAYPQAYDAGAREQLRLISEKLTK
ncbi:MAG TPA: SDR family NAD(P)-dependent oxidoreductase [Gemmatimonadaceae bacterium]|nr:SDR family NAD(P)-dependent oxidoreductase [Gemmatimonadaceae bacterium]